MVELYQWLQGLTLPLPALIVAGALLAVASNRNKPAGLPWQTPSQKSFTQPSQPKSLQTPSPQPSAPSPQPLAPNSQSSPASPPSPRPAPQLPNLTAPKASSAPPQRSISFTIRKPGQN